MGIGYQSADRQVIDYDLWFDPDARFALRGPRRDLEAEDAICCIGAAQTFGRFVDRPYANQLNDLLEQTVINLGVSGAGPGLYLSSRLMMGILRRAQTVIVQVMSARSITSGVFKTQSNQGVLEFVSGPLTGQVQMAQAAYRTLRREYGEDAFREQVATTQATWLSLYEQLASELPGRKLLLWMSGDEPGENVDLEGAGAVGRFPHFVTREMIEQTVSFGFEPVFATVPGMPPQVLIHDRTQIVEDVFDAEIYPTRPSWLHALNNYYATPDIHDRATRLLLPLLIGGQDKTAS